MNARDVMSKPVVSVHPDTPLREVAQLLLDKGISAMPVVDDKGALIGMVSEDDLIRPDRAAREAWANPGRRSSLKASHSPPSFLPGCSHRTIPRVR
jgi:CBS-domain-containing membrane protein